LRVALPHHLRPGLLLVEQRRLARSRACLSAGASPSVEGLPAPRAEHTLGVASTSGDASSRDSATAACARARRSTGPVRRVGVRGVVPHDRVGVDLAPHQEGRRDRLERGALPVAHQL